MGRLHGAGYDGQHKDAALADQSLLCVMQYATGEGSRTVMLPGDEEMGESMQAAEGAELDEPGHREVCNPGYSVNPGRNTVHLPAHDESGEPCMDHDAPEG